MTNMIIYLVPVTMLHVNTCRNVIDEYTCDCVGQSFDATVYSGTPLSHYLELLRERENRFK